ncbi:MAG TPA: S1 RNA-binding domain-containing protein [Candidatus Izemoplasmatales bacterium]|nr:S1 RNA-binding domain-containing protein [Candidatus Izemoplasmatales bacterium]
MKEGEIVKGTITCIRPYGAFVKVGDLYDGLVHISEITDGFVRDVGDFFSIGQEVEFRILKIHKDNKLSLSYRGVKTHAHQKFVKIELTTGFESLEKQLPKWIEEYQKSGE